MTSVIGSDLKKARNMILDMKISVLAEMDEGGDVGALSAAYDLLNDAYDALCDAADALGDE